MVSDDLKEVLEAYRGHTMQVREVLHNLLIQTCREMHALRREALEAMVWASLTSQRMTVTGLAALSEYRPREAQHQARRPFCCQTRTCNPNARRYMGCWRNGW